MTTAAPPELTPAAVHAQFRADDRVFVAGGCGQPDAVLEVVAAAALSFVWTPWPPYEIDVMKKLVALCKQRGFVFQSSEIYGGVGSVWDYGPLGVELKR